MPAIAYTTPHGSRCLPFLSYCITAPPLYYIVASYGQLWAIYWFYSLLPCEYNARSIAMCPIMQLVDGRRCLVCISSLANYHFIRAHSRPTTADVTMKQQYGDPLVVIPNLAKIYRKNAVCLQSAHLAHLTKPTLHAFSTRRRTSQLRVLRYNTHTSLTTRRPTISYQVSSSVPQQGRKSPVEGRVLLLLYIHFCTTSIQQREQCFRSSQPLPRGCVCVGKPPTYKGGKDKQICNLPPIWQKS